VHDPIGDRPDDSVELGGSDGPRLPHIPEITTFNRRMGWTVPFVSWEGSDFNFDIAWTE
jgi:hypothetical protein